MDSGNINAFVNFVAKASVQTQEMMLLVFKG